MLPGEKVEDGNDLLVFLGEDYSEPTILKKKQNIPARYVNILDWITRFIEYPVIFRIDGIENEMSEFYIPSLRLSAPSEAAMRAALKHVFMKESVDVLMNTMTATKNASDYLIWAKKESKRLWPIPGMSKYYNAYWEIHSKKRDAYSLLTGKVFPDRA
jgi:hypothetical protein